MLSFQEIEDCFPDGACSDDATGTVLVSAQWLHDFAHAVAAKEREACANISPNGLDISAAAMPHEVWTKYRTAILARSNASVTGAELAKRPR